MDVVALAIRDRGSAPRVGCAAIEHLLQPVSSRTPTAEDVFSVLRGIEPLDGHAQLSAWVAGIDGEGR